MSLVLRSFKREPLTPYGFARANLASLWYARNSVRDALAEMKQGQGEASAFSTLTAMMRGTKISTNDFICAKGLLEPYISPKTHLTSATALQVENIQTAAKFAIMVYDQHIDEPSDARPSEENADELKPSGTE